jgi:hypothetical protein
MSADNFRHAIAMSLMLCVLPALAGVFTHTQPWLAMIACTGVVFGFHLAYEDLKGR